MCNELLLEKKHHDHHWTGHLRVSHHHLDSGGVSDEETRHVNVLTNFYLSCKRPHDRLFESIILQVSEELREVSFCWETQQKVPQWS